MSDDENVPTGESIRFELADIAPGAAASLWGTPGIIEAMNKAIERVAKAERERCAMICEARMGLYPDAAMGLPRLALSEAASSIRSRS